jgi:hypothetical protein
VNGHHSPATADVDRGGVASLGATHHSHVGVSAADVERKRFETLRSDLAFTSTTLSRTDPLDGPVRYYAHKFGGLIKKLADLEAVAKFASQVSAD